VVDFYLAVDDNEGRATISVKLDRSDFITVERSRRQRQCQPRYIELPGFPFALAFSAFQPTSDILALKEQRRRIAHKTDPEAFSLE
jgi:hypothetical protein